MNVSKAASRRAKRKLERREAIVDAAARVFQDKGTNAATMDDVAEAAEVSKGTLYLYFSSKDDLFVALTHRPLDAVLRRFESLEKDDVDGLTLLRGLVDVHSSVIHAHATQMRVAFASMCGGFTPDPSAASLHEYSDRIERLRVAYVGAIERGMSDGSLRADLNPNEVAAGLWAGMFGASFIRMNADHFRVRIQGREALQELDTIHHSVAKLLFAAIATPKGEAGAS